MRTSRGAGRIPLSAALALFAVPAAAHEGTGLAGGFVSGFLHPLSGADHLLAMVAVGLWGAFLGRPLVYGLPVLFPSMMVVGAILGMFAVPMPPVEIGIAVSVLVLGACIALRIEAATWAALLQVATFAIFHGYAHGRELPSAADPVGYSAGFVFATGALHVTGICLGQLTRRPRGVALVRGMGGVIAVAGAWFLEHAVAP